MFEPQIVFVALVIAIIVVIAVKLTQREHMCARCDVVEENPIVINPFAAPYSAVSCPGTFGIFTHASTSDHPVLTE